MPNILPLPSLPLPVAVVASLAIAGGSAWMATQRTQASLVTRMDGADHRIEAIQQDLKRYVPAEEFGLALGDVKRELDEIRSDVKEIRRGVARK